jgi:hypothetical protein
LMGGRHGFSQPASITANVTATLVPAVDRRERRWVFMCDYSALLRRRLTRCGLSHCSDRACRSRVGRENRTPDGSDIPVAHYDAYNETVMGSV